MGLLIAGIILWAVMHLLPSIAPELRRQLIAKLGLNPYKLLFTAVTLLALGLIILGWRGIAPQWLYTPPAWSRHATMSLMLIACLAMGAHRQRGRLNRILRHPQLTGVSIWAVAHLIANGENRAVVLFTTMLGWAMASMALINRRDGAWEKPTYGGIVQDLRTLIAAIVMYAVLVFAHRWITGIPLIS